MRSTTFPYFWPKFFSYEMVFITGWFNNWSYYMVSVMQLLSCEINFGKLFFFYTFRFSEMEFIFNFATDMDLYGVVYLYILMDYFQVYKLHEKIHVDNYKARDTRANRNLLFFQYLCKLMFLYIKLHIRLRVDSIGYFNDKLKTCLPTFRFVQ